MSDLSLARTLPRNAPRNLTQLPVSVYFDEALYQEEQRQIGRAHV